MSPITGRIAEPVLRFPRVSGDEPNRKEGENENMWFSPRERG